MKKFLSQAVPAFAFATMVASSILAQDFGTAELPMELAEPGTKVIGVLNKVPGGGRNLGYSEGPACDSEGSLYFTEDNAGRGNIWKVSAGGQGTNYYNGPGMPNGLEFDKDGNLFSAELGGIAKYNKSGGAASRAMIPMNPALNQGFRVNDLTMASNGWMFFTNHAQGHQYFFRGTDGSVTTYNAQQLHSVTEPNGIEYIEEKKQLLICFSGSSKVFSYDVGDDGKISNRKDWANVPVPDGLTLDEKGNVYIASYGSGTIHVFGPNGGTAIGKIKVGSGAAGNTSNCVFGGPGNKTLFITGNGGAYKVQLKVAGRVRPGTTGLREGLLRADPSGLRLSRGVFNPGFQSLGIGLPVGGGRYSVRVFDARFREVWNAATGDPGLEWNGLGAVGEPLPSGRYLILAQSAGSAKSISAPVDIIRR